VLVPVFDRVHQCGAVSGTRGMYGTDNGPQENRLQCTELILRDKWVKRGKLSSSAPSATTAQASRMCRGVRHSASNIRGELTRTQMHFARDAATFRRSGRKETPFGAVHLYGGKSSSNR
jgi:hypothetical protein